MEVKSKTFNEITITREELDTMVASFVQAQVPNNEVDVGSIEYITDEHDNIIQVYVKSKPL